MKVLFATENKLMHYRMPIFKIINETAGIDLTLAHSEGNIVQSSIHEILLPNKHILGPVNCFRNFHELCSQYDVVLCMAYYNNIAIIRELLRKRRPYKLVLWGIGVRASYQHGFGSKSPYERLIKYFSKKADALVFYSDYPISLYEGYGIPKQRLFVANNTVECIKLSPNDYEKNQYLFIGSLYKEKGLDLLIYAYYDAIKINSCLYPLIIIGDGDIDRYNSLIRDLSLQDKVILTGGIYDEKTNAEYFAHSILCVSPNQAGLSVLKSMGYGVPFVTAHDAITGGERLNIKDGVNGFYCDSQEEITNILIDSYNNPDKYKTVGINAYNYYWSKRQPQNMADGLLDSIRYVYDQKEK